jgi:hypothetical protein
MTSDDLTLAAFAVCNVLRAAAYLPQMLTLYSHPGAAASFSYASWWLFAAANASTAAYGQLVVGDAILASLSALSAACCGVLIGIARWRRRWPVRGPDPESQRSGSPAPRRSARNAEPQGSTCTAGTR